VGLSTSAVPRRLMTSSPAERRIWRSRLKLNEAIAENTTDVLLHRQLIVQVDAKIRRDEHQSRKSITQQHSWWRIVSISEILPDR